MGIEFKAKKKAITELEVTNRRRKQTYIYNTFDSSSKAKISTRSLS